MLAGTDAGIDVTPPGTSLVAEMRELVAAGLSPFEALAATPGNRGVYMLRRLEGDRAEWIMLSLWEDEDAVRAFAGDDISVAVFYPEDDRYLVERDLTATHFEVVDCWGAVADR